MKTRSAALRDLGLVIADIAEKTANLTPLEAAQRAWRPDGPSVAVLATEIAADRRLAA